VPLHDRQHCFCRSGKIYRKCCKKWRYYYRDSLDKEIPPPSRTTDKSLIKMLAGQMLYESEKSIAAGETPEERGKKTLITTPTVTAEQQRSHISATAFDDYSFWS
jgi:hypothetical protein